MSKVGLVVECETCAKNSRIVAEEELPTGMVIYGLDCGHRNGWDVPLMRIEYHHSTRPQLEYLHSQVRAAYIDRTMGAQMLKEIRQAAVEAGTDRVLLQYDIEKPINQDLAYYLMGEVITMFTGMRVAWVSDNPDQLPVLQSSLDVASDRGEEHRYFTDLQAAASWLISDSQ